uniref:Uncharacterized protein n=1 Tax=Aegilops tauschii subsp. strangulata TaxID=200361 RepID=A0A453R0F2_AEGTS
LLPPSLHHSPFPPSLPSTVALTEQVQALQRDKEILKTNLNKAEEEVKLLFEENRALDEANKRLLCLLEKEQKHRSERKHSASNSTKGICWFINLKPIIPWNS